MNINDVKHFYSDGAHGIEHIRRVLNNSLIIAKTVKCDIEVVKASALLHDIARSHKNHEIIGAEMAQEFLKNYNFTPEQVNNIIHSIRVHRYSKGLKPETIEAAILQDADRLDAIGAIVIPRVFYTAGERKVPIHDPLIPPEKYVSDKFMATAINYFYEKILKITPETFNTDKGKEMAVERYVFVKKFIEQFLKEWK